jgi:hypothetical protein
VDKSERKRPFRAERSDDLQRTSKSEKKLISPGQSFLFRELDRQDPSRWNSDHIESCPGKEEFKSFHLAWTDITNFQTI